MQKIQGEVKKVTGWLLDSWWEKTIYVFGVIYTTLLAIAMVVGVMSEALK